MSPTADPKWIDARKRSNQATHGQIDALRRNGLTSYPQRWELTMFPSFWSS